MALGSKNVVIYQTLLLLCFAAAVSAHGNGASDMNTEVGGMSEPATQHVDGSVPSNSTQMGPPSYFRHPEYSTLMVGHIVLMSIGWIFTLPLGKSPCHLPYAIAFADISSGHAFHLAVSD